MSGDSGRDVLKPQGRPRDEFTDRAKIRELRRRYLTRTLRYDPATIAEGMLRFYEARQGFKHVNGHLIDPPDWTMPRVHVNGPNGATPLPYGNT